MRIEQNDFEIAIQLAYKNRKEAGINFDTGPLGKYRILLNELAGSRRKGASPVVTKEEFETLKGAIGTLLKSAATNFAKQSTEVKANTNVKDYVFKTFDYAIALMLDGLKCNEIPKESYTSFTEDISAMAKNLADEKSDTLDSPKKYFKKQRRTNADKLEAKISEIYKDVNESKSPSPENVAKLYAEYQALLKRQKNHTGIWRYFHKEEDANRTALLESMKSALAKHLSTNTILLYMDRTPSQILKFVEHKTFTKELDAHLRARDEDPASHMGYDKYRENPDVLKENSEVKLMDLVKLKYRPNLDRLDEEIKKMQELRNAVVRGLMFKNDPDLKQLVYRNYLRLGAAEAMGKNPDWEKYCEEEDARFAKEHPGYKDPKVLPDKVPTLPEDDEDIKELDSMPEISEVDEEIEESEEEKDTELLSNLAKDTSEKTDVTTEKIEQPPVKEDPTKSLG